MLTKLQIVQIEEKDLPDATALLIDLPVGRAADGLDVGRFTSPIATDWGFFHTVELNLPKVVEFAARRLGQSQAQRVAEGANQLRHAMEAVPSRSAGEREPGSARESPGANCRGGRLRGLLLVV